MVGLFEHEADGPANILRRGHVLDIQRILGVDREMVLEMGVYQTRFEGADAHSCPGGLHTQVLGQGFDSILCAGISAGRLTHLCAEDARRIDQVAATWPNT